MFKLYALAVVFLTVTLGIRCTPKAYTNKLDTIRTGAEQTEQYLKLLKGKKVGILANPTTIIGKSHLVDSLQKLGVEVVKVFGPEHGFRGNASNGAKVNDETDAATGIKIISLYGKKRKPSADETSPM